MSITGRRGFFAILGLGLPKRATEATQTIDPIPAVTGWQLITAADWNRIVDAVNALIRKSHE